MTSSLRPNKPFDAQAGEIRKFYVETYIPYDQQDHDSYVAYKHHELTAMLRKALMEFIDAHEGLDIYIHVEPERVLEYPSADEIVADLLPGHTAIVREAYLGTFEVKGGRGAGYSI